MNSEMAAALRQIADRVEQGAIVPDAQACAIVFADAGGTTKATYIGRDVPADSALIHLMARGIEHTIVSKLQGAMTQEPVR